MSHRAIKFFCWLTMVILLFGCQLQFRSAKSIPTQLHILYLDTPYPSEPFSIQLKHLLSSVGIELVALPNQAPLILKVLDHKFEHDSPPIASNNNGNDIIYTYSMTTKLVLINTNSKIIVPEHTIHVIQRLALNPTQLFIPNMDAEIKRELQRETINMIYYWLSDQETYRALIENNHYVKNKIS